MTLRLTLPVPWDPHWADPGLNGCVVAEAFAAVASRTGFGATLKELDLELRAAGWVVAPATITYALTDVDGTLLVFPARDGAGTRLNRDGWQVLLPVGGGATGVFATDLSRC